MNATREILRMTSGGVAPMADEVVVEEPLEIRVEGKSVVVTMRTPGHDRELAGPGEGDLTGQGLVGHTRQRVLVAGAAHRPVRELLG